MSAHEIQASETGSEHARRSRSYTVKDVPFWGAVTFLWLQFFLALLPTWGDGTYYDYGYFIPPLLAYFLVLRWRETRSERTDHKSEKASPGIILVFASGIFLTTILRLIESLDASWRLPLYLHFVTVLALSACLLKPKMGSSGLIALSPLAIIAALSLPLPSGIENSLILTLTDFVAESAVFINRWLGYPVEATGSTLFVENIPLYVSEGCSGIRSFQGILFASVIMGEFFRLQITPRLTLVVIGLCVSLFSNTIRVVYLVRHAAIEGEDGLKSLHDSSGYIALSIALLAIFLIALLLSWRKASVSH